MKCKREMIKGKYFKKEEKEIMKNIRKRLKNKDYSSLKKLMKNTRQKKDIPKDN